MSATALLDWRRKAAAMYAAVRANPDPAAAHIDWQQARNDLLANHPESPIPAAEARVSRSVELMPPPGSHRTRSARP